MKLFYLITFLLMGGVSVASVPAQNSAVRKKTPAATASVISPLPTPTPDSSVDGSDDDKQSGNVKISTVRSRQERSLEENLGEDIKGGSTTVRITSNTNSIINLGLAQRGVAVVEFPAGDPIYAIHPGDENFVTIDCQRERVAAAVATSDAPTGNNSSSGFSGGCLNSPTDALVFRPGKEFTQWLNSPDSMATVITVQRISGIVVSFVLVPVKNIANNSFYTVVRYDLTQVVEARLKAGLAVNLNQPTGSQKANPVNPSDNKNVPASTNPGQVAAFIQTAAQTVSPADTSVDAANQIEQKTLARLQSVGSSGQKLSFNKPVHGISLAVVSTDRTTDYVVDIVAVRNTLSTPLRLVPDQPELFIENRDAKDKSVISERLPILFMATTAGDDDILLPNEVYYFGIAYKQPIMGAKQVLRVGFAGREASDEPAVAFLSGSKR